MDGRRAHVSPLGDYPHKAVKDRRSQGAVTVTVVSGDTDLANLIRYLCAFPLTKQFQLLRHASDGLG